MAARASDKEVGEGKGRWLFRMRWKDSHRGSALFLFCTFLLSFGRASREIQPSGQNVRYRYQQIAKPDGKRVFTVNFMGHSQSFITSNSAGFASVWALTPPTRRVNFSGPDFTFQDIALSVDGRTALTPAPGGRVRLWQTANGHDLQIFKGLEVPTFVALSQDGSLAAAAGVNSDIHIWNVMSGKLARGIRPSALVLGLSFQQDAKTVVFAENDGNICTWYFSLSPNANCKAAFGDPNTMIKFPDDGHLAVFADHYGAVTVWSIDEGRALRSFESVPDILDLEVSPDTKLALTGTADGAVDLWDMKAGRLMRRLIREGHQPLTSAAFSSDSKNIVLGFEDGGIAAFDLIKNGKHAF